MRWSDAIGISLGALRDHPLRSFLTLLGIIVGITAVTTVVAVGEAGRREVERKIQAMGSRLLQVGRYSNSAGSRLDRFVDDTDGDRLLHAAVSIEAVAAEQVFQSAVETDGITAHLRLSGTVPDFARVRHLTLHAGRFLADFDGASGRQVMVLNQSARVRLFPRTASPIGATIRFHGRRFVVIGVVSDTLQEYGPEGAVAYLPLSALRRLMPKEDISMLWVLIREGMDVQRGAFEVASVLAGRYGDAAFDWVRPISDLFEEESRFMTMATIIIGLIAAISLLVSGIGLMNTLMVGVGERIREIGIRCAVGATRRQICLQFFLEGFTLCVMGGVIGVIVGMAAADGVGRMLELPVGIVLKAPLIGMTVSSLVGIVFSLYPAVIAARLDPVTALRME